LFKTQIEAKVHVKPDTPKFIPVEENLFITIATNIFRQLMIMTSRNGQGVITMVVENAPNKKHLLIDFISSEFITRKEINIQIKNLVNQTDFKAILKFPDVEPHIKVAKILSNKLSWRLEFIYSADYKFRLIIPINQALSDPQEDQANLEELDEEESKADYRRNSVRTAHSTRGIRNKAHREAYEVMSDHRPLTSEVRVRTHTSNFFPVREQPILEDSHDSPLATSNRSFASFHYDTKHCASVLLLNSDLNLKEFIANKFAMKCDESFTDKAALRQITKALNERKKCNCQPYKHFVIDFSG